jgi:hypothetical protein
VTRIVVPLSGFPWSGDSFSLSSIVRLERLNGTLLHSQYASDLADDDRQALTSVQHCLIVDSEGHTDDRETGILFLLALWLVRPTATKIGYRFVDFGVGNRRVARLIDQFQWNSANVAKKVNDTDLEVTATYFGRLALIALAGGRLRNALFLTLRGREASSWSVSFILLAAAVEALLTYSEQRGLTRRLARAFACITEIDQTSREEAYIEFRRLYVVRSDIAHGRAFHRDKDQQENIADLAKLENRLRTLWRCIIDRPTYQAALETDDTGRITFFAALEKDLVEPKLQGEDTGRDR